MGEKHGYKVGQTINYYVYPAFGGRFIDTGVIHEVSNEGGLLVRPEGNNFSVNVQWQEVINIVKGTQTK